MTNFLSSICKAQKGRSGLYLSGSHLGNQELRQSLAYSRYSGNASLIIFLVFKKRWLEHVNCNVLLNSVFLVIMFRPLKGRDLNQTLCSQDADAEGHDYRCCGFWFLSVILARSLYSRHWQELLSFPLLPSCRTCWQLMPLTCPWNSLPRPVQESGCSLPTDTCTQPILVHKVSLWISTKTQLEEMKW